jgi:hypothetical protein
MDIGEMNFNGRNCYRRKSIAKSNAGMRVGARIDQNSGDALSSSRVKTVYQGAFVIGLKRIDSYPEFGGQGSDLSIDIRQSATAVNFRFTGAEQVKVGPMQH